MKTLLSLLVLGMAWTAQARLSGPDQSGIYDCRCQAGACSGDFTFTYDRDSQFATADGPFNRLSGHTIRQEQKETGSVYVTLPRGYYSDEYNLLFVKPGEVQFNAGIGCIKRP